MFDFRSERVKPGAVVRAKRSFTNSSRFGAARRPRRRRR